MNVFKAGIPALSDMAPAKSQVTRFEFTRILGARALQISLGAPVLIDVGAEQDPILIAKAEFEAGAVPIIILRMLPDKTSVRVE